MVAAVASPSSASTSAPHRVQINAITFKGVGEEEMKEFSMAKQASNRSYYDDEVGV